MEQSQDEPMSSAEDPRGEPALLTVEDLQEYRWPAPARRAPC